MVVDGRKGEPQRTDKLIRIHGMVDDHACHRTTIALLIYQARNRALIPENTRIN